jgi:hypothetical protein
VSYVYLRSIKSLFLSHCLNFLVLRMFNKNLQWNFFGWFNSKLHLAPINIIMDNVISQITTSRLGDSSNTNN